MYKYKNYRLQKDYLYILKILLIEIQFFIIFLHYNIVHEILRR